MATVRYSFIVVARRTGDCAGALKAISALRGVEFSSREIILAIGSHPSQQRNAAAKLASGEFLVFLDDDSIADPSLIQNYEKILNSDEVGVVGGPSVCKDPESFFKQMANAVLVSPFGLGPFRARYFSKGSIRTTNERELILCNLIIRRDLFLENGGFRRDLYPNEENELLTRLAKKTKMIYQPEAICYRQPRGNFPSFARQFFAYGFGRAKHYVFLRPVWNAVFLLPSIFSLANLAFFMQLISKWNLALISPVLLIPGGAYLTLILLESMRKSVQLRQPLAVFTLPLLFWTCHFAYGLGFISGILRRPFATMMRDKKNKQIDVRILSDV